MQNKKIVRRILIIFIILLVLLGGLYSIYQCFFNPYRGTMKKRVNSQPLTTILSREEALEDLAYLIKYLEDRHPACMDGLPTEVQEQYEKEVNTIIDDVSVLHLWQSGARILSKLKDAHTNIGFYTDDNSELPLTFKMIDGNLICTTQPYNDYAVKSINDIPVNELYTIFINQYPYELESYVAYNFARLLPRKSYLAFLGLDTTSAIHMKFHDGTKELEASFPFTQPSENEIDHAEGVPFVSYQIDKERNLGILTLLSCDYNEFYKETLHKFFAEVKENQIENVAVDLRNNGGGNSYVANEFLRYLDVDTYYTTGGVKIRMGTILQNYKKEPIKNEPFTELLFTGNVYALTSTQTFSSAKMFANILSDNQIGQIIGEIPGNMPASYGDILHFQTPNARLPFTVSYKYFNRIDETKADQPLYPDYEVEAEYAMDKLYEIIENMN